MCRIAPVVCIAVVGLIALTGCGSSKPAYCSTRNNLEDSVRVLENSIKGLTISHFSSGLSDVKADLEKVRTNANMLVSQVKGELASETSAIKSSVASFESAVKALVSSPSAAHADAVKSAASSIASSLKSFADATSGKCS
jgi:hypothetical protein